MSRASGALVFVVVLFGCQGVGEGGLGPPIPGPEPGVLPLDYSPVVGQEGLEPSGWRFTGAASPWNYPDKQKGRLGVTRVALDGRSTGLWNYWSRASAGSMVAW